MKFLSSFRFRLVVWNALVVMLIYAIAAAFIYLFMRDRLESVEREKLDEHLAVISTVVYKSGGDKYDWYHLGDETPFLILEDWQYRYQTIKWRQLNFPKILKQQDFEHGFTERKNGEQHFQLKYRTVRTGIDTMHTFQVILAMENTNTVESIDGLAAKLSSGMQFILILALVGGNFLANRALKPVKLMRQTAQHISAQSLSERLPVVNPSDEIGQLTTVFNDLLSRLEQAFNQLRRFTSDASHEFRTPLTSIRSIGQVALKNTSKTAELKEAIGSMLEETERLTQLVNHLLLLTRNDAGQSRLDYVEADLVEHINIVIDELKVLAEEKNIEILFTHPEKVLSVINMSSFHQAISNVLHNAILYTPANGFIKIMLSRTECGNIQIDIEDTGNGIEPTMRKKVFERFFRIDDARSNVNGGSGLGLAIAKSGIELNQGNIQFVDGSGKGATCRINFTLKK